MEQEKKTWQSMDGNAAAAYSAQAGLKWAASFMTVWPRNLVTLAAKEFGKDCFSLVPMRKACVWVSSVSRIDIASRRCSDLTDVDVLEALLAIS